MHEKPIWWFLGNITKYIRVKTRTSGAIRIEDHRHSTPGESTTRFSGSGIRQSNLDIPSEGSSVFWFNLKPRQGLHLERTTMSQHISSHFPYNCNSLMISLPFVPSCTLGISSKVPRLKHYRPHCSQLL